MKLFFPPNCVTPAKAGAGHSARALFSTLKKSLVPAFAGMTGLGRSGAVLFFLVICLRVTPALAVQPDEILSNPVLEARARAISAGLRCLVCQNQSIDESDASVARDLRILIREQLQQNKSDDDVVGFVVDRYGDYVLLKPRLTPQTLVLWLTPFLIILAGAVALVARHRQKQPVHDQLSDAEKADLDAVLRK